jgi:hypothetical protein
VLTTINPESAAPLRAYLEKAGHGAEIAISPGIDWELGAILAAAKQNETIIILEPEPDRSEERILKIMCAAIKDNPTIAHSPTFLGELRKHFDRIVQSPEIPFENIRLSTALGDILETIESVSVSLGGKPSDGREESRAIF